MALLSKNWRNEVTFRGPKTVPVESLGREIIIRPMTAARQSTIDKRFEDGPAGSPADLRSYTLAIVADSIVGTDGEPVFTHEELLNADGHGVEWTVTRELSKLVADFLNAKPSAN